MIIEGNLMIIYIFEQQLFQSLLSFMFAKCISQDLIIFFIYILFTQEENNIYLYSWQIKYREFVFNKSDRKDKMFHSCFILQIVLTLSDSLILLVICLLHIRNNSSMMSYYQYVYIFYSIIGFFVKVFQFYVNGVLILPP